MEDFLDQNTRARERISISVGLYVWFIVSIVGLWFIFRDADPKRIPVDWVLYPLGFAMLNFFAFEWGWICGRIYYQWWGGYMLVLVSVALVAGVFWFFFLGERTIGIFDLWRSNPSAIWTIAAVERSNLTGLLFLILIAPACYGASRSRRG